jgi:hypothetical protein
MEILEFIENFRCGLGQFTDEESGITQRLFENGFCYYFAKILQDAFPGGELYIPWPIGHFVYKYNDAYWDISGEYNPKQHDCVAMIPLNRDYFIDDDYIRHIEKTFMHNGYSKNEYTFRKNVIEKSKDLTHDHHVMIVITKDIVLNQYEFKLVPIVKYYNREYDIDNSDVFVDRCSFIKDQLYKNVPDIITDAISSERLEEIISFFIEKNVFSITTDNFEVESNVTIKI